MHKNFAIFLFTSLATYSLSAQTATSLKTDNQNLQKIEYLFNDEQYTLAQEQLENYIEKDLQIKNEGDVIHAQMMRCLCAIRLELPNAIQLSERFLQDNPESSEKNLLNYELANYAFNQKKFDRAIHYFEQCDFEFLTAEQQDKFHLYSAYSLFKQGKTDEAIQKFEDLTNSNNRFKNEAYLYKGLLYFEQKNWLEAFNAFGAIKNELENDKWAVYYGQSLYNLKRYKEVIVFTKNMTEVSPLNKKHLNVLEGMSYNQSNDHKNAVRLLQKTPNLQNDAQYALGFSLVRENKKEQAKDALLKVATNPNPEIYQNAQFLLAKLALETNNKAEAIDALKRVKKLNLDKKITENAHYQLIKLSFEHNDIFSNTEQLIAEYTEKYPSSIYLEEVYDLLIQNYVKNKQYDKAILSLEDFESKHIRLKSLYQEVCLFRGIQLYNLKKYDDAITLFTKSLAEAVNKTYTDKARFWIAESYYQKKNYDQAISHYKLYKKINSGRNYEEDQLVDYNLAYSYFNKGQYHKSIHNFDIYLLNKGLKENQKVDAFLRLGDANMMIENYQSAKTYFRKASIISGDHADYAAYSEAICNQLLNEFDAEVSILTNFDKTYPNSIYKDDARFQLAESYLNKYKYAQARENYKTLISDFPKSEFYSTAELRLATINYNQDLLDLALQDFKNIVSTYPNTSVSKEAIRLIKNVYFDLQTPEEYHNYVAQLEFHKESEEGLDDYSYLPVYKQFTQGNYDAAQKGFEFYLKTYPNGLHKNEANYYLAECYIKSEKTGKAEKSLENIANSQMGDLSEEALYKLARINFNKKDYKNAKKYYQQLFDHSRYKGYTEDAQIGLMQTNYKLKNYQEVMQFATKVLQLTNIDDDLKTKTKYLLATSAYHNNSFKIAKENLKPFLNDDASPRQAEATSYMIKMLYAEKSYHKVISYTLDNIKKINTGDQEYLYPSLMLYGNALGMVNNKSTARQAYQSIIDQCPDKTIVEQAKKALKKLK